MYKSRSFLKKLELFQSLLWDLVQLGVLLILLLFALTFSFGLIYAGFMAILNTII